VKANVYSVTVSYINHAAETERRVHFFFCNFVELQFLGIQKLAYFSCYFFALESFNWFDCLDQFVKFSKIIVCKDILSYN
jgi:hypothetical protein